IDRTSAPDARRKTFRPAEPSCSTRYGGGSPVTSRSGGEFNINLNDYTIMPAINSLRDLLVDELRDLHNAENQLVKALPKMAKAASNDELKDGLTEHLEQPKGHI